MQTITLIALGKLNADYYAKAAAEYAKRLSAYCRLNMTELPEERLPQNPSQAQIDAALAKEAEAIQAKLPKGGKVVALCVEGDLLSSPQLAKRLDGWMVDGASQLTFVIGGSFGLHPAVKAQAHLRLSMSPMTFPHHLARVMVLEQLYRAFQITAGIRYHK